MLSEASQPILVEVRTKETSEQEVPRQTSQQVQTDFCDNWSSERTYYNYNQEENFIYPELQYEVNINQLPFMSECH